MAGPTSRLPLGLLDMLGISAGSYPRTLLDEIRSTIDLTQLLAVTNCLENVSGVYTPSLGSNGSPVSGNLAVPQGEVWLVSGATAVTVCTAVQAIRYSLATMYTAGGLFVPVQTFDIQGQTLAAVANNVVVGTKEPFWLTGGMIIGLNVETFVGALSTTVQARILRCRK